jgi:hypothetical protein
MKTRTVWTWSLWQVWGVYALVGLALMLASVGCEQKTTGLDGASVTAQQLVQQGRDAEIAAEREREAKDAADARALREAQAAARKEIAKIRAGGTIDQAEREAALADIAGDLELRVEAVKENAAANTKAYEDALARIDGRVKDGLADIQAKEGRILGVARVVDRIPGVSAAVGGATGGQSLESLATLVVGGLGVGWLSRRAKKKEDDAWDEAEARAEKRASEQRNIEALAWAESAREAERRAAVDPVHVTHVTRAASN